MTGLGQKDVLDVGRKKDNVTVFSGRARPRDETMTTWSDAFKNHSTLGLDFVVDAIHRGVLLVIDSYTISIPLYTHRYSRRSPQYLRPMIIRSATIHSILLIDWNSLSTQGQLSFAECTARIIRRRTPKKRPWSPACTV